MSEREKIIEVMARAQCSEGGFDHDERMPNDGPRWGYYVPGVTAALAALEAAGVRLVPSEATQEMTGAVWATDLPRPDMHGDYQDLDIQVAARDIYRAMLAASPYAPTQKEQTHESD